MHSVSADQAWSVSLAGTDAVTTSSANVTAGLLGSAAGGGDGFECGNNNSEEVFSKMNAFLAETERLRQHCRQAASTSAARSPEEKVNLDFFSKSIDAARDISLFAKTAIERDESGGLVDRGAPIYLGHLSVPEPFQNNEQEEEEEEEHIVVLPGVVEVEDEQQKREAEVYDSEGGPKSKSAGYDPSGGARSPPHLTEDGGAAPPSQQRSTPPGDPESAEQRKHGYSSYGSIRSGSKGSIADSNPRSGSNEGSQDHGPFDSRYHEDSNSYDDDSDEDESSEGSNQWPPKPPLLRFKMRIQFSQRFKGCEVIKKINKDIPDKVQERAGAVSDMVVGWINKVFEMAIETDFSFEVGFPVIVLTMLDAIYVKRVRWQEVDWRFQYKRAIQRNFEVLERIWAEVNMEKAREFRVENTLLRLENMETAPIKEKIEFVRMMKRWFDQRIHHAEPYDALVRRSEIVELCRTKGHAVKFPSWIKFVEEKKDDEDTSTQGSEEKKRAQLGNALLSLCRRRDFEDDVQRARALVDAGANVHMEDGCPEALFVCCALGHEQTACLLIDWGADLSYKGRRGVATGPTTAFEYGESMGQRKMVSLLRAHAMKMDIPAGDASHTQRSNASPVFQKMPEFRRLIWFLGSPEHQTM
jgi:hypothetical protein